MVHMNEIGNKPTLPILFLILTLIGACSLYLFVLSPVEFGTYHDDGIYVTTAKALATGQGYKIASLPDEPSQTKYPPLYPFLLSLIWRVYPEFPQNLSWMLFLSVVAMVGFLIATYRYLTEQRYATEWQALIVVGLAAINWRTMILATSIYSETIYALLSVVALGWAEKFERQEKASAAGVLSGVLMGLAFLTRSLGVTLIVAVAVYYSLKGRLKKGILATGVAGMFVMGWIAWCYANGTSAQGVNVANYTSYLGYLNQVVHELQEINQTSRIAVVSTIVIQNLIGVILSVPLVCSGLGYGFFLGVRGPLLVASFLSFFLILLLLGAGFVRQIAYQLRLLHVYIIVSLIVCLFWLPNVSYDRFLMPLLPFLLLFLVVEFERLMKLARKEFVVGGKMTSMVSAVIVALGLLLPAGITLYSYGSGAMKLSGSWEKNAARAEEDDQAIAWIKTNADSSDTLICYRDPKYFLFTGRKAVRSFPMTAGVAWQEDQASLKKFATLFLRIVDEAHGRYVVITSTDFELEDRPEQRRKSFRKVIEAQPERFVLAFESADGRSKIYRIENDGR
jgi:hypothetical protein